MSTLTLELDDSLAARLEAASAASHVAPEVFIRKTLERSLAFEFPPTDDGRSLYERMKGAIGCIDSGVGDLATNPKHLEGYGQWRR